MRTASRHVRVYAHWRGLQDPALMGHLLVDQVRGKEIFSFEYTEAWLAAGFSQQLDPHLQHFPGTQHVHPGKRNFGIFLDSAPDRWGRVLMRRREALRARQELRPERSLGEIDFLLGVHDRHRAGALRFQEGDTNRFLNDDTTLPTPPWTSLRTLEAASLQLERDDAATDAHYEEWLNLLMAPGSSLGGARPKASVVDELGQLWIAKFPSRHDTGDTGAWEAVVHELAKGADVKVPEARWARFSSRRHTFMSQRFDRTRDGHRIHFASAMTLLGADDGADATEGASYLQLAEFIIRQGARPAQDLEELWRRIVFNICVHNTDDHLRNHGFLLTPEGWVLSPAFDINPIPSGQGLSLNISESDNRLDLTLAMDVAHYFHVKAPRARQLVDDIQAAVGHWKTVARRFKLPQAEINNMALAFTDSTKV